MSKVRDLIENYRLRDMVGDNYGEFRPDVEILSGSEERFYYDKGSAAGGGDTSTYRMVADRFTNTGDMYERIRHQYDDNFTLELVVVEYDKGTRVKTSTYDINSAGNIKEIGVTDIGTYIEWTTMAASTGWTIPPDVDLSVYITKDGLTPFEGNQSMGGNKLTSVSNGTTNSYDAPNMKQLQVVEDAEPLRYVNSVEKTSVQSTSAYTSVGSWDWQPYLISSDIGFSVARNKLVMVSSRLMLGNGIIDVLFRLVRSDDGSVIDSSAVNNHIGYTQSNVVILESNFIVPDISSGVFNIRVELCIPTLDPSGANEDDYPYFNAGHDGLNLGTSYRSTLKTVII